MMGSRTPTMKRKRPSEEWMGELNTPTMKRNRSTEEWIEETNRHSSPLSRSVSFANNGSQNTWPLYEQCLKALSKAVPLAIRKPPSFVIEDITAVSYIETLKALAESLYLWGEDLGGGRLDFVLSHFNDLRDTALHLLVSIGEAITQGKRALLYLTIVRLTGAF